MKTKHLKIWLIISILIIMMVSIATYVKTIILSAYLAGVFDRHMSDQALTNQFKQHEAEFNKIAMRVKQDKKLTWIDPEIIYLNGKNWPSPESKPGFEERWNEYRKFFKNTGVIEILRSSETPYVSAPCDAIFFRATAKGGSRKGYVYSETPLSPLFNSLDSLEKPRNHYLVYRHLKEKWYLFFLYDR
jgi:hypothetical protein